MNRSVTGILGLAFLAVVSCAGLPDKRVPSGPFDHIGDDAVRSLLEQAVMRAGGIDTWRYIAAVSYTKRSKLILEDGAVESDLIQHHKYRMQPEFSAVISWKEQGNAHVIRYRDVVKEINGERDSTADPQALRQTVASALYTLGMPFKLLDKGVLLIITIYTFLD